jgi:sugar lactone lactonase YvrE
VNGTTAIRLASAASGEGVASILCGVCLFIASVVFAAEVMAQATVSHQLTKVYENNDFQITGITVSKRGRMFVNFPHWSDLYLNALVEVMPDGSTKPFPDEHWNRWDLKQETAGKQFVCVQSVVADDQDALWVVDAAAPLLIGPVRGGAKLVRIDLKTNQVSRVFPFGPDVAKPNSYMNDVRIDTRRNTAYLTDSGVGGVVIVDLNNGTAHRALDGHTSVSVEPGVQIVINGKSVQMNGMPPQFQSDSLALSPDGEYLYYKALTGNTLYRVKTEVLRKANADSSRVAAAVENLGKTFPTDGFWMDSTGNLYLSDLSSNAVSRRSPDGKIERLVADPRLQWPDTFSEGPDGTIYISASHINESPSFNQGKSVRKQPYAVFKFKP